MNLASILGHQWAISPAGAKAAAEAIKRVAAIQAPKQMERRPKEDWYGQPIEQPRNQNGVHVIPMKGIMLNNAEPIYKMFGYISHQDVAEDLKAAASAGANLIVLDVDSPGGSATGTPELADMVKQLTSEVNLIVFCSNVMCSAAMYTAAGATRIYATGSAIVGCIGTVMEHLDASQFFADMGVEFQQFKSGTYKGMGHEGIPLTEVQKEFLQDFVDQSAGKFKDFMLQNRPDIAADDMEGQFFSGDNAKQKGFIDEVIPDIDSAIGQFR
jgi:signal peptide peptidase SppA